jgi:hypothetical protein
VSFSHGSNTDVYLQGVDATAFLKDQSMAMSIEAAETTVFGVNAKQYIPGLGDATHSLAGFFDSNAASDSTSFDYFLQSLVGVDNIVSTTFPGGDTFGARGYGIKGEMTKAQLKTDVSAAATSDIELQSDVAREVVVSLHNIIAETASGNSAGNVDNGALSTNGGVLYYHVMAITGTASPTVAAVVQHSVDAVTWVDLATATTGAVNAARSAGRVVVPAGTTVNRYTRLRWTITGTTPSITFTAAFGRK